jgi:two-component system chemotaxis sensor kinase CheA
MTSSKGEITGLHTKGKGPIELIDDPDRVVDSDIVARCEQAEETLQFTQFAIDNFWDAIIWTKADGRINYANDAACRLLNYPRPELVTKTIGDIVPAISTASWDEHWQSAKEQQSHIFGSTLRTSDGQEIPVRVSVNYMAFRGREYNCFLIGNLTDQYRARENLQQQSTQLEQQVAERTASLTEEIEGREKIESMLLDEAERIQNILDNAGQGFLTFGEDLKVDLECSQECRLIFGNEIWGRPYPELLYPDDEGQREFLASVLTDVFVESDPDKQAVYFSLLPGEVNIGGDKFIEIMYREISGRQEEGRKVMVIMTDVTETRRLKEQVEEEKGTLKMVVRAVVQYDELAESIRDYRTFCSEQLDVILRGTESPDDKLYEIFRQVHTFKGTFSQLDLTHVVSKLNQLETHLSQFRRDSKAPRLDTLEKLLAESHLDRWLDKDLKVLTDILGKSFFSHEETLDVKSSQIAEIEAEMISSLRPGELRELLPRMKQLRYCPFRKLLRPYPEYLERLSSQLQKPIMPMIIEGSDVMVDPELYRDFTKTLVHVFRNAVDHGIEPEDTRLERGKDPRGQVKCSVNEEAGKLLVTITDDGGGIDPEQVKQKALTRGVLDPKSAATMSEDDILQLIFEDEISTRETASEYSGRGMGLSAVKEELEKLGGQVTIQTDPGRGTVCTFAIPIMGNIAMPRATLAQIMDTITECADRFMTEEMGLTIDAERYSQKLHLSRLHLDGVIALIRLKGSIAGLFAMCFEPELARYLVSKFAVGELIPDEETEYLADTMAEISNIVLGSTMNVLPAINGVMSIGTPTTCITEATLGLSFEGPEMWTAAVETDQGKYSVNLLMLENN